MSIRFRRADNDDSRYYVDLDNEKIGWVIKRNGRWVAYLSGEFAGPHRKHDALGWKCDQGAPTRREAADSLVYWYRRFNVRGF